jgi:hypothetical protein
MLLADWGSDSGQLSVEASDTPVKAVEFLVGLLVEGVIPIDLLIEGVYRCLTSPIQICLRSAQFTSKSFYSFLKSHESSLFLHEI